LSAEVRHNLFLAVKEALNNVVKHAQASEVRLRLMAEAGAFALWIEDDGHGIGAAGAGQAGAKDRLTPGQGLSNMERRLREIGGSCQVGARPGGGTRVELRVARIGDSPAGPAGA
jgi:signal transduction histidine kinase